MTLIKQEINKRENLKKHWKNFRKRFKRQRILKESAALTYVTLLGFIPFVLFTLFLLPSLPFITDSIKINEILVKIFLPSSVDTLTQYLNEIIAKRVSFNVFNFVILLTTSYSLFKIINDSFDNILHVHELKRLNFWDRILKFLGMIIFGAILILILFSSTSLPIFSAYFNKPLLLALSAYALPFFLLFILIVLGYFFIPTISIQPRSVVIGGATSAFAWIIAKSFFNFYIQYLSNMKVVYGVLAILPIFLFWIYVNWVVILSGVIIIAMLEKRGSLKMHEVSRSKIRLTIEREIEAETEHLYGKVYNSGQLQSLISEIFKADQKPDKEE